MCFVLSAWSSLFYTFFWVVLFAFLLLLTLSWSFWLIWRFCVLFSLMSSLTLMSPCVLYDSSADRVRKLKWMSGMLASISRYVTRVVFDSKGEMNEFDNTLGVCRNVFRLQFGWRERKLCFMLLAIAVLLIVEVFEIHCATWLSLVVFLLLLL